MVYLIYGMIDEPGAGVEWEVCAYLDQSLAELHAERAQNWADTARKSITDWKLDICAAHWAPSPYDEGLKLRPNWHTEYYVRPVALLAAVPA